MPTLHSSWVSGFTPLHVGVCLHDQTFVVQLEQLGSGTTPSPNAVSTSSIAMTQSSIVRCAVQHLDNKCIEELFLGSPGVTELRVPRDAGRKRAAGIMVSRSGFSIDLTASSESGELWNVGCPDQECELSLHVMDGAHLIVRLYAM